MPDQLFQHCPTRSGTGKRTVTIGGVRFARLDCDNPGCTNRWVVPVAPVTRDWEAVPNPGGIYILGPETEGTRPTLAILDTVTLGEKLAWEYASMILGRTVGPTEEEKE